MAWTAETLLALIGKHSPDECITEARLSELAKYNAKQTENACRRLLKHGFIVRTGQGCHQLTQAGKDALAAGKQLHGGPLKGHTGHKVKPNATRQKIWNVLRKGEKVTVDDVVMLITEDGESNPRNNVSVYLRTLAKVGYIIKMPVREKALNLTSNGAIRWLLVNDTGPKAPTLEKNCTRVYDHNTETSIPVPKDGEGDK